jgi:hypothetical protein
MSRYRLTRPPELTSEARLGGLFNGPSAGERIRIWSGRPPMTEPGFGPKTLSISCTGLGNANVGQTVSLEVECGNAWGGITRREFQVGQGLSAELAVGNWAVVNADITTTIPDGMTVFFSWTLDLIGRTRLTNFLDYPVAATTVNLPEGVDHIIPENACNITFQVPQFGTTFVRAATAGERIPALWGAISCNVVNKFICELRGL